MRRKFRHRQKTGIRISLRTLLYAGTIGAVALLAFSVFVVSFFKDEEGSASVNPMVVTGITVAQDTVSVYSGMRDVPVLKVTITTRGTGNRLSITDITFSAWGTSQPVNDIITNARLWYTAGEPVFLMTRQYGNTIEQFSEGDFIFNARQLLQEGSNHFWLAYDTGTPMGEEIHMDAEMIRTTIGTLVMEPDISAPAGQIKIKSNTPWYSTGSTDIASLESWNSRRDGSGNRPANFSKSSGTFHIQAGHSMLNKLNACLPSLIIERNGTLINETSVSADLLLVNQGGTLMNKTNHPGNGKLKKLRVENGGMYVHATEQDLIAKNAVFAEKSTATFLQTPSGDDQAEMVFGNVVIAEKIQSELHVNFPLSHVKGDLEIRGSGLASQVILSSGNALQISGDLVVNNATLILSSKGKTQNITIGKKFYIKNGSVTDGSGMVNIEMGNDFLLKEGALSLKHPESTVVINKPNTHWYQSGNCILPNVVIQSGAALTIKSENFGEIGRMHKFKVSEGAILDCDYSVITGSGKFEIEAGATLLTSHPKGICSDDNEGSIQTTGRSFSSAANYHFTGAASPQLSGNFETTPMPGTVKNLIIHKSDIAGVVVLQTDINCTGEFVRKRGSLNKNGYSIQSGNSQVAEKAATAR